MAVRCWPGSQALPAVAVAVLCPGYLYHSLETVARLEAPRLALASPLALFVALAVGRALMRC